MATYTSSHSKTFTNAYSVLNVGYTTFDLKLNFTQVYNTVTNKSSVTLTSVQFRSSAALYNSQFFGGFYGNGQAFDVYTGGTYMTPSANQWLTLANLVQTTITVDHDANGAGSFTLTLGNGVYSADAGGDVIGFNSSNRMCGVYESNTATVELTSYMRTLTVNPNGGTWGGSTATQTFTGREGATKTIANPTFTGRTFEGWTKTGGGSLAGTTYTYGSSDGTLKAGWQKITYQVTYNANGGSGAPAAQTKTYGTNLKLSSTKPTRSGYAFKGWATTDSATTAQYQPGDTYTANAALTLYAVWVQKFTLSTTISESGITVNINRTSSPNGGGSTGLLHNGDTLYYGDKVTVSWSVASGSTATALTINSVDVTGQSPKNYTISGSMTVVMTVTSSAVVRIYNGSSWDDYEVLIYNGSGWDRYKPIIWNGSSWEDY